VASIIHAVLFTRCMMCTEHSAIVLSSGVSQADMSQWWLRPCLLVFLGCWLKCPSCVWLLAFSLVLLGAFVRSSCLRSGSLTRCVPSFTCNSRYRMEAGQRLFKAHASLACALKSLSQYPRADGHSRSPFRPYSDGQKLFSLVRAPLRDRSVQWYRRLGSFGLL
jgi:hypothetical protein